jgi:enoyl-CoA hydratase/carnithine racemase
MNNPLQPARHSLFIALILILTATPLNAEEAIDCNLPYAAFGLEPLVVNDFTEMAEALASRAATGNYCAQFELGMMYLKGVGVAKEDGRGLALVRQAADSGHADALHSLGLMYAHGRHVQRDGEQAIEHFYRAGQSYLKHGNRRLALREIDYIVREQPGHPYVEALRGEVHNNWLESGRNRGD